MRWFVGLLVLLLAPAEALSQTADLDRTKIATFWSLMCEQNYLANNDEAKMLAILKITLAQQCECVSVQTTSKMNEDDAQQIYRGMITPNAQAAYSASRQFCLAAMARRTGEH